VGGRVGSPTQHKPWGEAMMRKILWVVLVVVLVSGCGTPVEDRQGQPAATDTTTTEPASIGYAKAWGHVISAPDGATLINGNNISSLYRIPGSDLIVAVFTKPMPNMLFSILATLSGSSDPAVARVEGFAATSPPNGSVVFEIVRQDGTPQPLDGYAASFDFVVLSE
jgi:hypothetical protein